MYTVKYMIPELKELIIFQQDNMLRGTMEKRITKSIKKKNLEYAYYALKQLLDDEFLIIFAKVYKAHRQKLWGQA